MSKRTSSLGRVAGIGFGVIAALGIGIQLVPFGRDHSNPPVVTETQWDSQQTRDLFYRACADCHSHETKWPWYSNVAPVSWLVMRDVQEGREHFNISDATASSHSHSGHDESPSEPVREGQMPLWIYLIMHPEARLTEAERQQLVAGLDATFGGGEGTGAETPSQ